MDGDKDRYTGKDGYSDSDGVHETSFNTASEGGSSDVNIEGQGTEAPIRSSRSMPVAEHLRNKYALGHPGTADGESLPPPSYSEAVSHPDVYDREEAEGADEDDALTPEEIAVIMSSREDINNVGAQENEPADGLGDRRAVAATGDDLSTEQAAMYHQRQKDRNDYLPSGYRRDSFEEAMEMLPPSEALPKDHLERAAPTDDPDRGFIAPMQIEEGRGQREEYTCEGWGPLDEPMTRFCRFLRRQSRQRLILLSLFVMVGIGLLLFVSLFPASFVYVNYHQIALKQSKMTNVVDRDNVYYPGCYVLGPDTKLLFFTGSVHNIVEDISVFTTDTIAVTMRFSVHYFIRPPEVGHLFTLFHYDYDDVFQKIVKSTLRNYAGSSLTVENFRFNRTYVETQMHATLRKRLGGDCCPQCCKEKVCQSNAYCSMCKAGNCDQGYHVDVRFFHLLSVSIPNEVFEKLLYRTILEVRKEKEFFLQDHAIMVKKTEQLTQIIRNDAKEITQASQFEADKIGTIAEADMENVVQNSYATALQGLYSRLNVTQEDHKLSLMMIRELEESADNLYSGFGFEQNTLNVP